MRRFNRAARFRRLVLARLRAGGQARSEIHRPSSLLAWPPTTSDKFIAI